MGATHSPTHTQFARLHPQVSDGLAWCRQPADGIAVPVEDAPDAWRLPVYSVRVVDGQVFVSERPTGPVAAPVTSDSYRGGDHDGSAPAPSAGAAAKASACSAQ